MFKEKLYMYVYIYIYTHTHTHTALQLKAMVLFISYLMTLGYLIFIVHFPNPFIFILPLFIHKYKQKNERRRILF